MDKDSIESLEQHLDLLIETSREIGIMTSNFNQQSQSFLNQKFVSLTKCLRDLDKLKDNFNEVKIPTNVFNYIDEGKNPVLYTKDFLMKTLEKNEEIKGKTVTFKTFREELLDELKKNFPEEYDAYERTHREEK